MNTDKKGLCSICCLGYNHGKFLEENIRAIWKCEDRSIEIIALDDGSPDNSAELLQSLAAISPCPMQVIAQSNTGNISGNFNTLLSKAHGELILFMALDDVLNPSVLSQQIGMMLDNPSLAFVTSADVMEIDDQGNIRHSAETCPLAGIQNPTPDDLLELEYSNLHSFYIQSAVFRKDVVDAVGGFDGDMTGDDIILRTKVFRYLKEHPEYGFRILAEPCCFYRKHDSNVHKNVIRQIKTVTEYLHRFWPDRENPPALIDWAIYCIQSQPPEKYEEMFTLNPRAANLLSNPRILQAIKDSSHAEPSPSETHPIKKAKFRHFFFKKEKLPGGRRKLTFFSLFSISYSK